MNNKEKYWLVKLGKKVVKRSDPSNEHPSFTTNRSWNDTVRDTHGKDFMDNEKFLQDASSRWSKAEDRRLSGKPYQEHIPSYSFNVATGEHSGFQPGGGGSWIEPNYDHNNPGSADMSRIPSSEFRPAPVGTQAIPNLPVPNQKMRNKPVEEIWYKNLDHRGAKAIYNPQLGKLKPQIEYFGWNPKPRGKPGPKGELGNLRETTPLHEHQHNLLSPNWSKREGGPGLDGSAQWIEDEDYFPDPGPTGQNEPWGPFGEGQDIGGGWRGGQVFAAGSIRPTPSKTGEKMSDEDLFRHGANINETMSRFGPLKRKHYKDLENEDTALDRYGRFTGSLDDDDFKQALPPEAQKSREAYLQALELHKRGKPTNWQPSQWDLNQILESSFDDSNSMQLLREKLRDDGREKEIPTERLHDMIRLSQKGGMSGLAAGQSYA